MGSQCQSLALTLRLTSPDENPTTSDHEATWALGHTERVSFGVLWEDDGDLYSDTVFHIPCRHLKDQGNGTSRCAAHGYRGKTPKVSYPKAQPRQLGGDKFRVVDGRMLVTRDLPMAPAPKRSLPVVDGANPCATARCETSDHKQKAACCRDMTVEIMCTKREKKLEALVRHRKAPYLCKVNRDSDFALEAELISACGYLGADGVACTLHGRVRADGRPAKPALCSDWPPKNEELHPGCVFAKPKRRR